MHVDQAFVQSLDVYLSTSYNEQVFIPIGLCGYFLQPWNFTWINKKALVISPFAK